MVYEVALCRGDVNPAACRMCIAEAGHNLTHLCPEQKEAITWYEKCMVRYSNRPIFGITELDGYIKPTGSKIASNTSVDQFSKALSSLLSELKTRAASGDSKRKFAFGKTSDAGFQTIYGLAQCTPDQIQANCTFCLDFVIGSIPRFLLGLDGGMVLTPSCFVRYEIYHFYDASADAAPPPQPSPPMSTPPSKLLSPPPPDEGNDGTFRCLSLYVYINCYVIGKPCILFRKAQCFSIL